MRLKNLAALTLLISGCGPSRVTVLNGSGATLTQLEVSMGAEKWKIASLDDGQSEEKEFKIKEKVVPRMSFLNEAGRKKYASPDLQFDAGDSRKVTFFINPRKLH